MTQSRYEELALDGTTKGQPVTGFLADILKDLDAFHTAVDRDSNLTYEAASSSVKCCRLNRASAAVKYRGMRSYQPPFERSHSFSITFN